ncbi:MAG: hypothetical protein Q7V88_15265 [Actinomycetota bacterium]|nr:hypothetical protein [Actinomycetota bacterium]
MGLFSHRMKPSHVERWARQRDVARLVEALHYGWDGRELSSEEYLSMRAESRDGKAREVREAAAYALAQMDDVTDTRVIEPLITSLDDPSGVVADVARRALERMTNKCFQDDQGRSADPARWRTWWKKNEHDRQLLREPLRSRRVEVWSETQQQINRAHETPLLIEGVLQALNYGDYQNEKEEAQLRQQLNVWQKSRDEQLAPELAHTRQALERKWRAQEDAWRAEDEAWLEEQRQRGASVPLSPPQILHRCPSCGADLQERRVLRGDGGPVCAYCRGGLPE